MEEHTFFSEGARMGIEHINPEGMLKSPAYSQGVVLPAGARMLLIGGQNGVDEKGQLVSNDFGEQSAKAIDNVIRVLEAAGGTLDRLGGLPPFFKGGVGFCPRFLALA